MKKRVLQKLVSTSALASVAAFSFAGNALAANGTKLTEFLSGAKAQQIYASVNREYPAKNGVASSELVKSWGNFKADDTPLKKIEKSRKKATELVDEVAFNVGSVS
ncbi:MAG: hypothetical protein GY948_19790 [Alphaproteobacteria bacterium]|nr:hypothetical protein [Alphaproteobacteria bacterium]